MRGRLRPKSFPIGRTGERTCAGTHRRTRCGARVQQEATHLRQAAFGHCCFQRGGKAQRIPAQRGNTWDTWYTGLTRSPPSQAYWSDKKMPKMPKTLAAAFWRCLGWPPARVPFTHGPPEAGSSSTAILRTPIRPLRSRQHDATIDQRPAGVRQAAYIGSSTG